MRPRVLYQASKENDLLNAPSGIDYVNLYSMHDSKSGRIIVDKYLEVSEYKGVFALGDCAFIIYVSTGNPSSHSTACNKRRYNSSKNIIAEKPQKKEVR